MIQIRAGVSRDDAKIKNSCGTDFSTDLVICFDIKLKKVSNFYDLTVFTRQIPEQSHFQCVKGLVLVSKPEKNSNFLILVDFSNIRTLALKYNRYNRKATILL